MHPDHSAKSLIAEAIVSIETGALDSGKSVKSAANSVPGTQNGKPALGVSVHAITNTNDYFVYEGALPGGIMIDEVHKNSPAEAAGLQAYDIIVEVDGNIATSTSVITQALSSHEIGETLKVKIYRVENYENAQSISDLGEGQYIDFEIELFEFNINT